MQVLPTRGNRCIIRESKDTTKFEEVGAMFYVVDQWGQYINEFEYREEAEEYCRKWNERFRFHEWGEPKAHVVADE